MQTDSSLKNKSFRKNIHFFITYTFLFIFSHFAQALDLHLVDSITISHKEKFMDTKMGGFSGLYWNPANKKLLVVSDDRGNVQPPRYYEFDLKIESSGSDLSENRKLNQREHRLTLKPSAVFFIGQKNKKMIYDLEGIAQKDESLLFISEGDLNKKPRQMPRIFSYDPVTKIEKDYFIPDELLPERTGKQKKGVRNNSAFEGLAISPSHKKIVVTVERPLAQVSEEIVPFLIYENDEYKETIQYPLSQNPFNQGFLVTNGVSEVTFLDENRLLVLERAAAITKEKMVFPSQIFEFDLKTNKKKLVLNLANKAALENYEGMAIINNHLLLVSDDNFSKTQKTTFVLFEIKN